MAANLSSSPSSPRDDGDSHIPTALALPAATSTVTTRRLPPPCWTPDETSALIDAYKDKWYSLSRSNLRANHWQEVADDVATRYRASPRKTAVQCRHKMEKLRKRYRAEIQRASSGRSFNSPWAHFQDMHSMEKGTNNHSPPSSPSSDEEEEEDDDDDDDRRNSMKRVNGLYQSNSRKVVHGYPQPMDYGSTGGVRIKIPGGMPPTAKAYDTFNEMPRQNPRFPNSSAGGCGASSNRVSREGFLGRNGISKRVTENSKEKKADSSIREVAAAIQKMGEGFMRIEKVKMDMAREMEEIRMEMELKRTEMILESQQRIVEAFVKGISEAGQKRMQTMPDC
ncbi:hypothetical protein OROGR_032053 [Orobanche gracilis]